MSEDWSQTFNDAGYLWCSYCSEYHRHPETCVQDDCDHDWLVRPESDTEECLICGRER